MPIRKKHVRLMLFILVMLAGVVPAAVLLMYGFAHRGSALDTAIEQDLRSRLRCEALVRGAVRTGPATARAAEVSLAWTAREGRLSLRLTDISAESNQFGWYLRAAGGELTLDGPRPMETMAALNQRLVQTDGPAPLASLVVERLAVRLDLGPLAVREAVAAVALSRMEEVHVTFHDPAANDRPTRETEPPLAVLRLATTSDGGVFGGFHTTPGCVPLGRVRQVLGIADRASDKDVKGTAHIEINWQWPGAAADAPAVYINVCGMDLADWTAAIPGGPLTGAADAEIRLEQPGNGGLAWRADVTSGGGTISGETLRWLGGLSPALAALNLAGSGRAGFETMRIRLLGGPDGLQFVDAAGEAVPVALFSTSLLGARMPLVWSTGKPLEADAAAKAAEAFRGK